MQNPALRPCFVATAGLVAAIGWAVYRAPSQRLDIVSHAHMEASALRSAPAARDSARDGHVVRAGRRRAVVRDLVGQLRLSSLLRH